MRANKRIRFLGTVIAAVIVVAMWVAPASAVTQPSVSANRFHSVGLQPNGSLVVTGNNDYGRCGVSGWRDITGVSAGMFHTVGLKSDGTAVTTGDNGYAWCDTANWTHITAVSAGSGFTVGLKSDGSVVATGWNDLGQCDVSDWMGVMAVSAGEGNTVGLTWDRKVVATGWNNSGQCNVSGWTEIVAVSTGFEHTVGLKSDGSVVSSGSNRSGQCNVSGWTEITAVSAGMIHTVGLKPDGTVVATGDNNYGQCNVGSWTDVIAVSAGGVHTLGLKSDGSVVSTDLNDYGQCNVGGWSLPRNSAPVAVGDAVACSVDASATFNVLANDTDVDGDPFSASVARQPIHGVVGLKPDGEADYCPDPGWSGTDTFTYRSTDGLSNSNLATVTITVSEAVVTGALYGTVAETGGAVISGASVVLLGAARSAVTASDGSYWLSEIPAGTCIATFARAGYTTKTVPVTIAAGDSQTVSVSLDRLVAQASVIRSPGKSSVTYRRKKGVARYTIAAVIRGWGGKPLAGRTVYLQSSKNGRSWSNTYKIKTGSTGKASKTFKVTTKRVRYYRWYVPAKSQVCLKTYSRATKVTVR